MKKLYTLIVMALALAFGTAAAQSIVTTAPSPLQEGSQNVVITYFANQGNKGLMGLTSDTPVFAHVGVITNLSNGEWAYAPSWGDNAPKYQLAYIAPNMWQLAIGDIRQYFGITNPNEHVQQIALVFRNGDCSKEGKTAVGGDIFVDVLPDGFQVSLSSDSPKVLSSQNSTVTFKAVTTMPAKIELYVDGQTEPFAAVDNATTLTKSYAFAQGKDYTVTAKASAAGLESSESLSICYPQNSPAAQYPGGAPVQGAVAAANGDVTFCLAAPGKTNAMIVGSWDNYAVKASNVMNYADVDGIRYFWTTVSGLDPDKEYPYYYIVDQTRAVGDPYARLVLDPYSDKWLGDGQYPGLIPYPQEEVGANVMLAVYKGARDNYDWKVKDFRGVDPDDLIIYELLLRDFTGTEGQAKGNGTLRQAMAKLDYLERLGVNAIELMPIQEFNGNNSWGYNTNFYFAPDKAYGAPDDYRAFIDECHSRGMAVILDVVFNQSDGLHPWYQLYDAGSNPFYNERAPHAYSVLNDWLQDNMLVQQQWTDMVRYWMTAYKVDGFRFDLVKGLGDNASYGGNASEYNTNKYNSSRVARMKAITDAMRAVNPYSYSINENLAGSKEENEMAKNGQLNWANINEAACQFAMGYSSDSNCNRFYAPADDSRDWGSTVSYAESHDEQRMAYKQDQWGQPGVKGDLDASMRRLGSVAAQMILSPGAHMIWQFGELGNGTSTKNADGGNNTDPKPVLWSYYNVSARRGLYDSYRQLNYLRNNNRELFDQTASFAIYCQAQNWANGRFIYASDAQKELVCVINPTLEQMTVKGVSFKQSSNDGYMVGSQSNGCDIAFDAKAGEVTLPGGAYVVIVSKNVMGIEDAAVQDAAAPKAVGGVGEIIINGLYAQAQAFNLSGQPMPSLQVPAGLYIVVVDGQAQKVAVK